MSALPLGNPLGNPLGLPRRGVPAPKPPKPKTYSVLSLHRGAPGGAIRPAVFKYSLDGEIAHAWEGVTSGTASANTTRLDSANLSWDESVLAFSCGLGSTGGTWVVLLRTSDLSVISAVRVSATTAAADVAGVAVSLEAGLVAISYGNSNSNTVLAVFSLGDFISGNGGDISNLTPLQQVNPGSYCASLLWLPNGKNLLVGVGHRLGPTRPTGVTPTLRAWPSLSAVATIGSALPDGASLGFQVSGDAERGVYIRLTSTNSTPIAFSIAYGGDGEAISVSVGGSLQSNSGAGSGSTYVLPAIESRGDFEFLRFRRTESTSTSLITFLPRNKGSDSLESGVGSLSGTYGASILCNFISKDSELHGGITGGSAVIYKTNPSDLEAPVIFSLGDSGGAFGFLLSEST